jgi:hypothetical protein
MWLGLLLLALVAVLTFLGFWVGGARPRGQRPSRGGGGVLPGRDYGGGNWGP